MINTRRITVSMRLTQQTSTSRYDNDTLASQEFTVEIDANDIDFGEKLGDAVHTVYRGMTKLADTFPKIAVTEG